MATRYRSTLVGVFASRDDAQAAVNDLKTAGFSDDQVRMVEHEKGGLQGALSSLFGAGDTDVNDLVKMGIPEDDAHYYERQAEAGHPVVVVKTDGRYDAAADVLRRYGAQFREGETTHRGMAGRRDVEREGVRRRDLTGTELEGEERTIQLHGERLRIHREPVVEGEVRIHKEVVRDQQSLDVPVTHEEVVIERHAVAEGESLHDENVINLEPGQTIRIQLRGERISVDKEPFVVEELRIGKQRVEETRRVTESVTHEEARIEREGEARVRGEGTEELPESHT